MFPLYRPVTVTPPLMFSSSPTRPESSVSSAPPPSPPTQSSNLTCEIAARLLFLNCKWVQDLPGLGTEAGTDLLTASWRDLFILSCAQFISPADIQALVTGSSSSEEDIKDMQAFIHLVQKIQDLDLDPTELTCLR